MPRASVPLRRYLHPYRSTLIAASGCSVARTVFELAQPWPFAIALDYAVGRRRLTGVLGRVGSLSPVTFALLAAGSSVLLVGGGGVSGYLVEYLSGAAGEKIGSDLRVAVFGRLQRLSLAFHDHNRTGDLVERLTSDVERFQEALVAAFEIVLPQLLAIAGMVAVLLAVDIELGLAALGALPLLACLAVVCERRIHRAERRTRALTGNLAGRATEVLHNVAAVQAFSRASDEERQFRAASDATMASAVEAIELEARIYPLTDLVLSAGTGLVLFVGILRVIGGALPVGTLLVVLAYASHLSAPIEELSEFATLAARGRAGAERLAEILRSDEIVADAPDAIEAPQGPAALCLRGVSFAYRAGPPALAEVNLDVAAGDVVCLMGPSGAGKSTLLALLLRLYDPDTGTIALSGAELQRLTLQSLRERIALVPQDAWIIDGTVEENIAFAWPDGSAEDIRRAAATALVDEFVGRLPDGYATTVGEGGALLSGGQRRRIALARAVLRPSPSLLLLDEPTSGLDAESEATVVAALRRVIRGRTAIIVSHAPSVAALADRIVVLDHGRIVKESRQATPACTGESHPPHAGKEVIEGDLDV
jgi:ATP-binding cassette subfamily B protein